MVATEKKKTSLARAVFSGSLGNMLEWFDYGLYGYFAAIISADFFVADDPIVGLLLSFLVFGTGFLVRPIGGILIGAYADKHGRIKALTLTILCMGVCTMLMGCLPTYSQVGILAPILLTVLRLLQRLATGGEFADVHLGVRDAEQPGFPLQLAAVQRWLRFAFGLRCRSARHDAPARSRSVRLGVARSVPFRHLDRFLRHAYAQERSRFP